MHTCTVLVCAKQMRRRCLQTGILNTAYTCTGIEEDLGILPGWHSIFSPAQGQALKSAASLLV